MTSRPPNSDPRAETGDPAPGAGSGHPEAGDREARPSRAARTDRPNPADGPDKGPTGEVRIDRYVGGRDLTHWYTPAGRVLVRSTEAVTTRLGPNGALILTLVIGLLIAFGLSAAGVQIYDAVTDDDGVAGFDEPMLNAAMTMRSPWFDALATGYTTIAGPIGMPIIAVGVLLVLAIKRHSWTPVILIVAAGGGSVLMTIAGKDLIGRTRPPLADAVPPYEYSPSFPSGHTLNAIVVAGIIAYLLILRRETVHGRVLIISAAALFALTVGLSRVFLGHHWFTDVLAGWVLGAAWLALVITAHRLYLTARRDRDPRAAPPPPSPAPATSTDATRPGPSD
ncbi:phosphatidic acid phosphatase [Subtercola sp. Z020]|uniref:phosphatase PAP2 family protein n=1 Tax=Subtercola sp. Z020 TaxID=2080582 RepID=UPI000CE8CF1E|nr:phosphatase PAP2 family protein [Subtercola sp. Z020]PPF87158.1 phosphatidic acid phosphatase [Subtercola sp. Z020]